jgi:chorismate synthase
MLRYLTSGESHGRSLIAILEGMPSGLSLRSGYIDRELARRQGGYGRGERQAIEKDRVDITSGVRLGKTLASPIAMVIRNKDWENWKDVMAPDGIRSGLKAVTRPRPGHADLAGAMKYSATDLRDILERSSARETAARAAVGAVAKRLLGEFGIEVMSWVLAIGGARCKGPVPKINSELPRLKAAFVAAEQSSFRCPDNKIERAMKRAIDIARKKGDSVGGIFGIFEVVVTGVPPGLGSHVQWDRKLDGRSARALMSIQAIKGVEVGMGFEVGSVPGSKVHDEIFYTTRKAKGKRGNPSPFWPSLSGFFRKSNNAGGIEGGMSNGEPIVLRAVMKPIPTLYKPLRSVDIKTKKPFEASIERSDVCAVPAASVVGEAVVAFEIARAFLEKFGGDSVHEIKRNYRGYLRQLKDL